MAEKAIERPAGAGERALDDSRARVRILLDRLAAPDLADPERARVRDELVHLGMPLAYYCARQFDNRGEPMEELVQVSVVGLLNAIDRYDRTRGAEFSTYATTTIIGELKRHFRDSGWAVSVPRRLRDLRTNLRTATAELTQQLGRSPTPRELAERLGVSVEAVVEGLESGNAYSTLSLEATLEPTDDEGSTSVLDQLGAEDLRLDDVEVRESIRPVLDSLSPEEKHVLMLRFFRNQTQRQIADSLGVSQMQVSRLLTRTLARLRKALEA